MHNIVFTVFDKASERWAPPATCPTVAVAKRQLASHFKAQGIDDEALADFEFFVIGAFDECSGTVEIFPDRQQFYLN